MHAKIIQYNSVEGNGIAITDSGRQYDFSIRHWRSSTAPAAGQAIDVTLESGVVSAVFVVSTEAPTKGPSIRTPPVDVLIAYAVFILSATVLETVSVKLGMFGRGLTLWDITGLMDGVNSSSNVRFFLILGFLSVIVPFVWQSRYDWFALLLPLLSLIMVTSKLAELSNVKIPLLNTQLSDIVGSSDAISVGVGACGAYGAAVFLGICAISPVIDKYGVLHRFILGLVGGLLFATLPFFVFL